MNIGEKSMNFGLLNRKMNEYMHCLKQQINKWFLDKLLRIDEDLRNIFEVEDSQSFEQLDLDSLLQVVDCNWFVITSSNHLKYSAREKIHDMRRIVNEWSCFTLKNISKEKVLNDINVIIYLMHFFDASTEAIKDLKDFVVNLEKNNGLWLESLESAKKDLEKNVISADSEKENVSLGCIVSLVADPAVIGAIVGITGNLYSVLINGDVKSFYREQIQKQNLKQTAEFLPLKKVCAALTAYQINNPSANNLYSLNSARIDFVPYQFRPALKMIHADIPRILVADDVGVGKTIEAGLILKEMEARNSLNSVLVICPRPLVAERKWQLEMNRFDENFTQLDGKTFVECIQEADRDGEWPERHCKTIIPYSLFNEDSIRGSKSKSSKKYKNLGLSELDPMPHFDLVIVDEAHNIRNSNTWAYCGVELFCRNADAVVFLTATPLQNSNNDLYTLLNLLRPDLVIDRDVFRNMSEPNIFVNNLLRIVRSQTTGWQDAGKREISKMLETSWGKNVIQCNPDFKKISNFLDKQDVTREEKIEAVSIIERLHSFHTLINRTRRKDIEDFCIRCTQTITVLFSKEQRVLYDALIEFEGETLKQHQCGSYCVRFMLCTLMRQASSCIYGLVPFLSDLIQKRLDEIQEDGELFECASVFNSNDGNYISELAAKIKKQLTSLPKEDPKLEKVLEIVKIKQKEENNRIIIFSSFRHTLAYLNENLRKHGFRVGQVDGSVPDEERYKLRERFLLERCNKNAIDILLFSEVGCEGLDYQFCDFMINYDLPWNPMRIEQRIGRIDRRGQKSGKVRIYNMITEDTIDSEIYIHCLSKIGVFEASIGDCSDILGEVSDQIFKIMFDPALTDDQRKMKIEKMADNEIMKVQELRRLAENEKFLYGFDLSKYIMDKNVQSAENQWINPQKLNDLVDIFMDDYLGKSEYIRGKSEAKTLCLAAGKRLQLLSDLRSMSLPANNNAVKLWKAFLKSDKPVLPITFDSDYAKENRNVTFLTQMHPLVIEAAAYESKKFPCNIYVRAIDSEIPAGDYEFLIYAWKYVGLRTEIKLVSISDNVNVEKNILTLLQQAKDFSRENSYVDNREMLKSLHYERWKDATSKYKEEVQKECEFRLRKTDHSYNRQKAILKSQVDSAKEEKIKRMRTSQLENLDRKYREQKRKIENFLQTADIHADLLVWGILHVDKKMGDF